MRARALWLLKRAAALLAVGLLTFLAIRVWDSQRGLPLEPWHTFVPEELTAEELDHADWGQYLAAEQRIFDELRTEVTQKLDEEERVPVNRYFDGSPVYPGRFADDWNRSHVLEPDGAPVGAAVLLHGLTDAPYSQRHIGELYRDRGFVAIIPRLPAHGTVPASAHRRRVGGLVGGDPARGARGPAARRAGPAAAPGRVLERRRARDAVRP